MVKPEALENLDQKEGAALVVRFSGLFCYQDVSAVQTVIAANTTSRTKILGNFYVPNLTGPAAASEAAIRLSLHVSSSKKR